MDPTYMIITGICMLLSWLVGRQLKSKFAKFSKVPTDMSGAEVAQKMLDAHGLSNVQVISTPGQLTDHYNPLKKTVNLSQVVYAERNVAAIAVAAHEVGHAVQHAKAYKPLTMRSKLVPVVSLSSRFTGIVLMIGLSLAYSGRPTLLLLGIGLFALTTLFSFVTLPVEFDASKRALAWVRANNILGPTQMPLAKNALKWAAMTYVVAAVASLGQLLYYVMLYNRSRN